MNNIRKTTHLKFFLLLLFGLTMVFIATSATAASSPPTAVPPEGEFGTWERYTPNVPNTSFNVTYCNPTASSDAILPVDINEDGKTDLLCFYFYPSGSVGIFARFAEEGGYSEWSNVNNPSNLVEGLEHCERLMPIDYNFTSGTEFVCISTRFSDGSPQGIWVGMSPWYTSSYSYLRLIVHSPYTTFDGLKCLDFFVMDLEGDGRKELVCPYRYPSGNTRTFALGITDDQWVPVSDIAEPTSFDIGSCTLTTFVGDVDGNGEDDLICNYKYPSNSSATFVQLANDGQLSAWTRWSDNQSPSSFLSLNCLGVEGIQLKRNIMIGDVNGDGLDDQICAYLYNNGTGNSATFVKTDTSATSGQTHSTWQNWRSVSASSVTLDECQLLEAVDVNKDGLTDLVCVYRYPSGDTVTLVQKSNGTEFTPWEFSGSITQASSFAIDSCFSLNLGDVDADGHPDIICTYLYPSGTSATFVQRYQPDPYTVFLPIAVRD